MRNIVSSFTSVSSSRWRLFGAAAGVLSLSGCLSLQVDNPNSLNIDNVFTNAANVESSIVGGWKRYYGLMTGANTNNTAANCPTYLFAQWGNVMTTATPTYGEGTQEPRVALDNTNNLQCANRGPWYDIYSAIASGRDAYQAIIANKLTYGTIDAATPNGKDTPVRLVFSKFIVAIGQLNLALRFDKAFITDIATPKGFTGNGDLRPYTEVASNAMGQLRAVLADLKAMPDFTLPATWINGTTYTRDDMIRIVMSFIVRGEVYMARTPAERDAVNWGLVLSQIDSTINKDFGQKADPAVALTRSRDIDISISQTTARVNNRLLGPADTSGEYQKWVAAPLSSRNAITITTPDRRIHGATNATAGTRFTFLTTTQTSATLAPYLTSKYRSNRYLTTAADSGQKAFVTLITLDEMKFIRAEALFRLGRGAEAAALINPTRIAAKLQPVTASGPPAGRDCVPRKDDGTCGDLFDAIKYEKRIELFPSEFDIPWYDERGWGRLVSGTVLHLPVSGRDLISLGLPYYTLGGGGPGSAP